MGKLSIAIVCTHYRYFGSKYTGVPIPLTLLPNTIPQPSGRASFYYLSLGSRTYDMHLSKELGSVRGRMEMQGPERSLGSTKQFIPETHYGKVRNEFTE